MNVENRRGRSITSASSSRLITPRSPSRLSRSATSNAGSPKNAPAPASSSERIDRSTTPTDAFEMPPYSSSTGLPSSDARNRSVVRRSTRSSSGRSRSSQKRNTSDSTAVWVSFRSSTFASSTGPNDSTVARTGAPPSPVSESSSTGCERGSTVQPRDAARSATFGSAASIGCARPERSPLTSATNTGTPASESCPAITCSVLVFPVPVAPATSPCRFTVESGSRTRTPASTSPPSIGDPRTTPDTSSG